MCSVYVRTCMYDCMHAARGDEGGSAGESPRSSHGILSPVPLAFGPEPALPSGPMAVDLAPADMGMRVRIKCGATYVCVCVYVSICTYVHMYTHNVHIYIYISVACEPAQWLCVGCVICLHVCV